MLWLGIAVTALVVLLIGIWFAGWSLPADHQVVRTLRLGQQPSTVWDAVADFAQVPRWNPNVRQVERLPDRNGCEVWRETYQSNDQLTLQTTESDRPSRLVREIADERLPFRGSWELVIQPATGGCRVTITERGEIPGPLTRVMFRLFHDPAGTVEQYLQALAARFAEHPRLD